MTIDAHSHAAHSHAAHSHAGFNGDLPATAADRTAERRPSLGRAFWRSFTEHPASVGETYGEHLAFAATLGAGLIGAGLAALVHAVLPALFATTASRRITALQDSMTQRGAARRIDR